MEEKKYLKISIGTLVCLIIIVILIMIIIGFGIYVYFLKSDKIETSKPISNVENSENAEMEEVKKSIKLDETKEYVYEKDRMEINETIDYGWGETETFTDTIRLPFLNINSEDARKMNETLQQQYDKASNSLKRDEYGFDYTSMKYEYSIFEEKVLSLKIENENIWVPGEGTFRGNVYNFDLETGEQLSKQQILDILNVMDDTIKDKIISQLEPYLPIDEYGLETLEDVFNTCDLDNYDILIKDRHNIQVYFPCHRGGDDSYTITMIEEITI